MNYNDVTIGIVTFKSEKVIFDCLKSIKNIKKIIIYDNSNDYKLKNLIKKSYPKIKFFTSKINLGFGEGSNKIINLAKTKYVLLLSPDTVLNKNCEKELIKKSKIIKNFSIIAPFAKENNYGFFNNKKINKNSFYSEVDYVKGFAMLLNKKKINKIGMFDKNIFLYLEEIDLCKRLRKHNQKIYICKKAKITHIGAKSSNLGFEYEKCRNWHWMWSKVYFDKKYFGISYVLKKYFFHLLSNFLKLIIFILFFNKKKIIITYLRLSGLLNSLLGNRSWYRPKLQ
tara:strand:+ start:1964 stop:2812 length:849 start_codon:yes stop_codon:yes gene_type:complete